MYKEKDGEMDYKKQPWLPDFLGFLYNEAPNIVPDLFYQSNEEALQLAHIYNQGFANLTIKGVGLFDVVWEDLCWIFDLDSSKTYTLNEFLEAASVSTN